MTTGTANDWVRDVQQSGRGSRVLGQHGTGEAAVVEMNRGLDSDHIDIYDTTDGHTVRIKTNDRDYQLAKLRHLKPGEKPLPWGGRRYGYAPKRGLVFGPSMPEGLTWAYSETPPAEAAQPVERRQDGEGKARRRKRGRRGGRKAA